jgi:FkbM family methyltransferase
VSDLLRRDRTWEGVESALLRAALRPGSVVVDAGANLGWHAVWAALAVGAAGRVYAFEPDPRNLALLRANGAGLPQLRALGVALGEAKGEVAFRRHGDNQGDSARVRTAASFTTSCWPGDALALSRLDVLKIDTQGSELRILQGFATTLARQPQARLIVELWPAGLERLGDSVEALLAKLWALERPLYLIDHEGGGLTALSAPSLATLAASLARSGGFSQLWLGSPP